MELNKEKEAFQKFSVDHFPLGGRGSFPFPIFREFPFPRFVHSPVAFYNKICSLGAGALMASRT
jgi:hypothetical protein